jgi:hypothetical protein
MQGLGDLVKAVTDALGIEQCQSCIDRQGRWNKLFPFKNPITPTEQDISFLNEVFEWYQGLPIPMDKVDDLIKCEEIWLRLFRVKTQGCKSCGASYQNNYMKDLKRLWENL